MNTFHETAPMTWPACSGPCNGGRKLCPSPLACQISDAQFRAPWPVRWPFIVALVAAVLLWVLER